MKTDQCERGLSHAILLLLVSSLKCSKAIRKHGRLYDVLQNLIKK